MIKRYSNINGRFHHPFYRLMVNQPVIALELSATAEHRQTTLSNRVAILKRAHLYDSMWSRNRHIIIHYCTSELEASIFTSFLFLVESKRKIVQ